MHEAYRFREQWPCNIKEFCASTKITNEISCTRRRFSDFGCRNRADDFQGGRHIDDFHSYRDLSGPSRIPAGRVDMLCVRGAESRSATARGTRVHKSVHASFTAGTKTIPSGARGASSIVLDHAGGVCPDLFELGLELIVRLHAGLFEHAFRVEANVAGVP